MTYIMHVKEQVNYRKKKNNSFQDDFESDSENEHDGKLVEDPDGIATNDDYDFQDYNYKSDYSNMEMDNNECEKNDSVRYPTSSIPSNRTQITIDKINGNELFR